MDEKLHTFFVFDGTRPLMSDDWKCEARNTKEVINNYLCLFHKGKSAKRDGSNLAELKVYGCYRKKSVWYKLQ